MRKTKNIDEQEGMTFAFGSVDEKKFNPMLDKHSGNEMMLE